MTNPDEEANLSDETSNLLSRTYQALVEGAVGVAASDREALVLSLGRILQRVRGGKFLTQVIEEWDAFREQGRIKDEYLDTDQHHECLQDVLDFLDGDSPDRVRFEAIKKVFLNAAIGNDSASVLPQQFMKVLRKISSGAAILLFSEYRYQTNGGSPQDSAHAWLNHMAQESPLKFPELVELHEVELMGMQLITGRRHSDNSGIVKGFNNHRITEFGFNLCEYIEAESIELGGDAPDA